MPIKEDIFFTTEYDLDSCEENALAPRKCDGDTLRLRCFSKKQLQEPTGIYYPFEQKGHAIGDVFGNGQWYPSELDGMKSIRGGALFFWIT